MVQAQHILFKNCSGFSPNAGKWHPTSESLFFCFLLHVVNEQMKDGNTTAS